MDKKRLFGRDQYGTEYGPVDPKRPKASLLELTGRRSAQPMYIDTRYGDALQTGYVIHPPRDSGEISLWVSLLWITQWTKER